jgi:NDP-sugar pyrophosphorylase family protein
MMPTVAILAGGLGTRLHPLTRTMPKSLVSVAARPFVAHQLERLAAGGFRRVVLCVGHLGEAVKEYVGNGRAFGLEVEYSWDGDHPLGTGGALRKACSLLGDTFAVTYGDSYLDIDYQSVCDHFVAHGELALMTVYRNRGLGETSNVLFDQGRVRVYDKRQPSSDMEHIDLGLILLRRTEVEGIPQDQSYDLSDLLGKLAAAGKLAGVEVQRRFYEIGSPLGLREASEYIAQRDQGRIAAHE